MKSNQRICERIIRLQEKRPLGEYKIAILRACEISKDLNYNNSPYELMFLENCGVKIK